MTALFKASGKARGKLIVDVSSLAYVHAWGYRGQTFQGRPSGHVYGSVRALCGILEGHRTNTKMDLVLALDGHDITRKKQFPEYKAHRIKKLGYDPVAPVEEVLGQLFNCTVIKNNSEEADDVIASMVRQNGRMKLVVLSRDRDLWQLAHHHWVSFYGLNVTPERLEEDFLCKDPRQIPLCKGVLGDVSDNLPTIPRYPKKDLKTMLADSKVRTAKDLMERALALKGQVSDRSIDLIRDHLQQVEFFTGIATLHSECTYEETARKVNPDLVAQILGKWGAEELTAGVLSASGPTT